MMHPVTKNNRQIFNAFPKNYLVQTFEIYEISTSLQLTVVVIGETNKKKLFDKSETT